ncbi:hypothetical protein FRC17_000539 [Serendipita sp. 399]|nr:hypothetical protein FRC17_000539 [Serendipita sp. 399]
MILTVNHTVTLLYGYFSQDRRRHYNSAYILGILDSLVIVCTTVIAGLNHHSRIETDGYCHLKLQTGYSIAIMLSDMLVALLLLSLFLISGSRAYDSPNVLLMRRKGPIGAILCFVISILHCGSLLLLGGVELAWIWLTSCSASVFLLTMVALWVANPSLRLPGASQENLAVAEHAGLENPILARQINRGGSIVSAALPVWARPVDSTTPLEHNSGNASGSSANLRDVLDNIPFPASRSPALLSPNGAQMARLSSSIHAMDIAKSPADNSRNETLDATPVAEQTHPSLHSATVASLFHPYYIQPLPPTPVSPSNSMTQAGHSVSPQTTTSPKRGHTKTKDSSASGNREYHYRRRMAIPGEDSLLYSLSASANLTIPGGTPSMRPSLPTSQVDDRLRLRKRPSQHDSSQNPSKTLDDVAKTNERIRLPTQNLSREPGLGDYLRDTSGVLAHSVEGRSDTPTYIVYGTALGSPSEDGKDEQDHSLA